MSESYPWEAKRRSVPAEPVASAPEPVVEYVPEPEAAPEAVVPEPEPEPEPEVEAEPEAEEPAPTPIRWPKK